MSLVCPQCTGSFDNCLQCPRCGVPLLPAGARWPDRSKILPAMTPWQHTRLGRISIGVLLAVGLYYGLLQLCLAVLRAMGHGDGSSLEPTIQLAMFLGLQIVALLAGGMIAGAGQLQGVTSAAVVGIITGAISLVAILTEMI